MRRRDVAWRHYRYGSRGVAWRQLSTTTRVPHGRCGEGGRRLEASSPWPPRPRAVAAVHIGLAAAADGQQRRRRKGEVAAAIATLPPSAYPACGSLARPQHGSAVAADAAGRAGMWDLDLELGAGQGRAAPQSDGAPPPRRVPASATATPRRQCAAVASRGE